MSFKPNVVIYNTGEVLWIPPAIYKSSCSIDVEFFPFDQQECEMKFGSWTFNGDQVSLAWYEGKDRVDLNDYVNSGTWDIINCPGKLEVITGDPTLTQITFKLVIRRKTLFYTVNLIIPCVLISFLSVCVFYLPTDAGEKMTMVISILLSLVVFLLLVSKILPPTSITIPLIAKYLLFTFIMNIFTILITVIIINWSFRTPRTHRMPKWVRLILLNYLPKILFMKRPNHDERWMKKKISKITHQGGGHNTNPRSLNINARTELLELSEMHHPNCKMSRKPSNEQNKSDNEEIQDGTIPMTAQAHKAAEAVRFISQHLKNEDEYGEVSILRFVFLIQATLLNPD